MLVEKEGEPSTIEKPRLDTSSMNVHSSLCLLLADVRKYLLRYGEQHDRLISITPEAKIEQVPSFPYFVSYRTKI